MKMRQKSQTRQTGADKAIKDIRRCTQSNEIRVGDEAIQFSSVPQVSSDKATTQVLSVSGVAE